MVADVSVVDRGFYDYCCCVHQGGSLNFVMYKNQECHVYVKPFTLTALRPGLLRGARRNKEFTAPGEADTDKYCSYIVNPETIETWVSARAELSAGMGSQPPCCPESSDLSWG